MGANPRCVTLQRGNRAQHGLAHGGMAVGMRALGGNLSDVEEAPGDDDVVNAVSVEPEVLGDASGKGAHTREMSRERRIDGSNHLMHRIDQVLGLRASDGGLFPRNFPYALAQRIQTSERGAAALWRNVRGYFNACAI